MEDGAGLAEDGVGYVGVIAGGVENVEGAGGALRGGNGVLEVISGDESSGLREERDRRDQKEE